MVWILAGAGRAASRYRDLSIRALRSPPKALGLLHKDAELHGILRDNRTGTVIRANLENTRPGQPLRPFDAKADEEAKCGGAKAGPGVLCKQRGTRTLLRPQRQFTDHHASILYHPLCFSPITIALAYAIAVAGHPSRPRLSADPSRSSPSTCCAGTLHSWLLCCCSDPPRFVIIGLLCSSQHRAPVINEVIISSLLHRDKASDVLYFTLLGEPHLFVELKECDLIEPRKL